MVLKEISNLTIEQEKIVFVAALGIAQQRKCFFLINELRNAGIKCEIDYSKTELKAQLRQANKIGASYAIIFGEDEADKKVAIIKNMTKRTQEEVPFNLIQEYLKNEIKI